MSYYSPQSASIVPAGIRRKLKPSYVDDIRGQYGMASEMVTRQKALDLEKKVQKQQQSQAKKTMKFQKTQAQRALGLNVGKLGLGVYQQFSGSGPSFNIPGLGSINTGSALGGGMMGYGLYSALNPKATTGQKVAATAIGGLASALLF